MRFRKETEAATTAFYDVPRETTATTAFYDVPRETRAHIQCSDTCVDDHTALALGVAYGWPGRSRNKSVYGLRALAPGIEHISVGKHLP
jgi:hypothetical protein